MKGKLTLHLCFWTFLFTSLTSYGNHPSGSTSTVETGYLFYSFNSSLLVNDTLTSLPDTSYYQIGNCSDRVTVCMDIPLSEIDDYQIFQNGTAYSSGISACNTDTIEYYDYSTLEGQGASGPYNLQSWIVNGMIKTTTFNSIAELVDSMNTWDPIGNWVDSTSVNRIYGGDESNTYSESMVIWVPAINAPNILDRKDSLDIKGTAIMLAEGFHDIIVNETATACADSFSVLVRCIQANTLNFSLLVGQSDQTCLDFSSLTSSIDTVYNLCPVMMDPAVAFSLINGDSCLSFSGLEVGTDTACILFCDDNELCDTTNLIVRVRNTLGFTEQNVFMASGSRDTICLDSTLYAGSIDTIYNYCPQSSGTYVNAGIDPANYCVYLEGVNHRGTDTVCIVICDFPDCDTLQLNVEVFRLGAAFVYDTVTVNQSSQLCNFDTTNLVGALLLLDNLCPSASGEFIDFTINNTTLCAEYTAIDVGTDTACVLLRDIFGNSDTTYLIVTAVQPKTRIIVDTIRLGLTVDYCLDTTELGGIVQDTLYSCQPFNGNAVTLVADTASFCIQVEGIAPGTDTICLVICDDLATCDTTIIYVTVDTTSLPNALPVAVGDLDSTTRNTPVTINVLANDFIPNNLWTQFFVIPLGSGGVGPVNGTTIGNAANGTIQYIPAEDFCGNFDLFSYSVCNANGCDTAVVTVFVDCPSDSLRVLNGFSPNGDSKNDTFTIEGIENYPNHTLYIYNRWGNLVLERTNYRNDWDGTWDGTHLPDGVYFYLLNTGEGESLSGYVLMHR